jgi:hypothetical protein
MRAGIYVVNPGSGAMHIMGFCPQTEGNISGRGWKTYDAEQTAYASHWPKLWLCEMCQRERDRIVRETVKQRMDTKK